MPTLLPEQWKCDICGASGTLEEALACEARGRPDPWPAGMVFREPWPHGKVCAIFEVKECGHTYKYSTARIRMGHAVKDYSHYIHVVGKLKSLKACDFLEIVAFLRKERPGEPVYIWTEAGPVEWKGDLKDVE